MIPALLANIKRAWRKLRGWRRLSFTSGGLVFSIGALAVGFAVVQGLAAVLFFTWHQFL